MKRSSIRGSSYVRPSISWFHPRLSDSAMMTILSSGFRGFENSPEM
jgi:hypothetical protein